MKLCGVFILLMTVLTVMTGCGTTEPAVPLIDAKSLTRTDVVPVRGQSLDRNRNAVYCATFQIVWDQFKLKLGGPVEMQNAPAMAAELNREDFDTRNLSADSYFVFSEPWKSGIKDEIARRRRAKFPGASLPIPEIRDAPEGYVLYSYLVRALQFAVPFDRLSHLLEFGSPTAVLVESFGYKNEDPDSSEHAMHLSHQVNVLSYHGPHDFVINLKAKSNADELILAEVPPEKTLTETIGVVDDRITHHPTSNEGRRWKAGVEPLQVPRIRLAINRRYSEVESKAIKNSTFQGGQIILASQDFRFRLDETGAHLESQAEIVAKKDAAPAPGSEPRKFIFDRPFLIMLREPAAQRPYFAAWIGNDELMEPFRH